MKSEKKPHQFITEIVTLSFIGAAVGGVVTYMNTESQTRAMLGAAAIGFAALVFGVLKYRTELIRMMTLKRRDER